MLEICGYTLLENEADYNEFVEIIRACYTSEAHQFNLVEPKHYPTLIRESVDGGTLCDIFNIETIEQDDLKELYNKLHEIFGKES